DGGPALGPLALQLGGDPRGRLGRRGLGRRARAAARARLRGGCHRNRVRAATDRASPPRAPLRQTAGGDPAIVRSGPPFAGLDEEAATSLRASMHRTHLERGDELFAEGDPGETLYVISEGKIKLGRSSSDGRENLLAILGPGEMFGELSLFDPGPRTATAT